MWVRSISAVLAAVVLGGCAAGDDVSLPEGVRDLCRVWTAEEYVAFDEGAIARSGQSGASIAEKTYTDVACVYSIHPGSELFVDVFWAWSEAYSDDPEMDDPAVSMLAYYYEAGLAPEGLIGLWGNIATVAEADERGMTQEGLGVTLAEATDTSRRDHVSEEYAEGLIALGDQKIQLRSYDILYLPTEAPVEWEVESVGSIVYGWSVVVPLLRFGEWHEDFLVPVAKAVFAFDHAHDGNWGVSGEDPVSFDIYAPESASPIGPLLEALSRNGDAAAAVAETVDDPRLDELVK